jgi:hypothetical protein
MSAADVLQDLADLCHSAAHQALDAMADLGPKPADAAAAHAWEQSRAQLQDQMNSLSAMAVKLSSEAVVSALDAAGADLDELKHVTQDAEDEIKKIKQVSDMITRAAQVLDVGLAVLALAAAPSVSAASTLAAKVQTLAKPLPGAAG